jgi:hypothetical protein
MLIFILFCSRVEHTIFSISASLIYVILKNIKSLSGDFYFNRIGLVLMKQCHFMEN